MPRGITIDSKVESQGFTMTSWSKAEAKILSLNSWAQFYHQPYANDWRKAREKATERKYYV